MGLNSGVGIAGARPRQIIFVKLAQGCQVHLHGRGGHEREPRVDTVLSEVLRKGTQEETAEHASETGTVRVALTVIKAPSGHVVWRVVLSEEPVAAGESDSVTEDGTTDGVT